MKFAFKKNRKILIGIIIIVLLVVLANFFQKEVKSFFYCISAPVQKVFWRVGDRVSDFFESFIRIKSLKKETSELKLKNQELLAQNAVLGEIEKENEVLRQALEIGLQKDFKLALVQIIGKDISQDFILINKDFQDGISEKMPVITQQKVLVGKISEIYENFSKVMLISNKKSSLDAKIQNEDKDVLGVAKGEGNSKILFDFVPREETLSEGNVVVTSALGGIFPEGLLVGQIGNIKKSDVEAFQQAEIKPFFDISETENLFIILEF